MIRFCKSSKLNLVIYNIIAFKFNSFLIIFFSIFFFAWGLGGYNKADANTLKIKNQIVSLDKQGDVFYNYPHNWRFSYAMDYWKPYMIQEVRDHVRYGNTALRFELRSGSCGKTKSGWDDCKNGPYGSERHELLPNNKNRNVGFKGNVWHTLSFYQLPFKTHMQGHNSIWQIHNDGDWAPMFNTDLTEEGIYWQRRSACNDPRVYKKYNAKGNDGCSSRWKENSRTIIIPKNEMFSQWNDVIMNVNYTTKDSGFLKMWVNGKLVYHFEGPILPPNGGNGWTNNSAMQFGIYRMSETGVHPYTEVRYYDEIRFAKKKCSELKLEELGYNCKDLQSQTTKVDKYNR
tara:strand:+ start:300 stop:1331 length:1032 start_codon:yes stop_codon:yes gene_type:complete